MIFTYNYIVYVRIYIYIHIYGKCLGFARTCNDDRRRIIIIISHSICSRFALRPWLCAMLYLAETLSEEYSAANAARSFWVCSCNWYWSRTQARALLVNSKPACTFSSKGGIAWRISTSFLVLLMLSGSSGISSSQMVHGFLLSPFPPVREVEGPLVQQQN